MYSNFLNENIKGEKKICSKLPSKSRGKIMSTYKEQKNWRECIAHSLILEGLISFNLPFPKHFPTILFWVPFYSNYYISGVFLFIPCCGFFSPEIMQDSEHPVLRLSQKTTVYIYDKNITNKIHKKCHGCHYLRSWWLPPLNTNMRMK